MNDPYREWDAAYLLGALSPKDRRAYEEHLQECPDCAADVASLAGVPGTLAMLPDDKAMETIRTAPPNLLPGLTRAVLGDRRRRRARVGAVMDGVAVTAAAVGAVVAVPMTRAGPGAAGGSLLKAVAAGGRLVTSDA